MLNEHCSWPQHVIREKNSVVFKFTNFFTHLFETFLLLKNTPAYFYTQNKFWNWQKVLILFILGSIYCCLLLCRAKQTIVLSFFTNNR